MIVFTRTGSPLGELLLVGEPAPAVPGGLALHALSVAGQRRAPAVRPSWQADPEPFGPLLTELGEYFAGDRTRFEVALATPGTPFQLRVWQAVDDLEYGSTTSYGQLARTLGLASGAVRAVAAALGANPALIVRGCHRVVGADGSLTGYAAGLERKQWLLNLEAGRYPLPSAAARAAAAPC